MSRIPLSLYVTEESMDYKLLYDRSWSDILKEAITYCNEEWFIYDPEYRALKKHGTTCHIEEDVLNEITNRVKQLRMSRNKYMTLLIHCYVTGGKANEGR